ncbi:hypothetical protein PV726_32450 [Streptomyces europaeiscabiei]|uniref:hypothetical protein n=1 Tax=Streptomyces europaeiscabiei TaxID=146819 RepID=UPI0029B5C2C0|nr:hypothetical protein [Streptomyces europaeiscabiei]MDX3694969.1 hypothetical protein [Streptomyces europaeiscabiei]
MGNHRYVHVDTRALDVNGLAGLGALRLDDVIRLDEPALGMTAGHWRAGFRQATRNGQAVELRQISDAEAGAYAFAGNTVRSARVSPSWASPFGLELEGMRLSDLRAALENLKDLPDDALVVITSATHPWDGRHSPAETGLSTGRYVPNPTGGGYGDIYYDEFADRPDEDVPADAVAAVFLSPTN